MKDAVLSAYKRNELKFIARNVFDGIIILAERTQKSLYCIQNSQFHGSQQLQYGFRHGPIKIDL